MPFAFHYAARSDVGMVRSNNEDSAYAGPHLLAMADGMGGHAGGDVASSTVIGALVRLDGEALGGRDVSSALLDRIHHANEEIDDQVIADPDLDGMGTTLIALLRAGDKIVLAHIGDSRAFMVRDGVVTQITKDHSFVQSLVDEGRITADEAQTHPQRSLVTRVLTGAHDDEPDLVVRQGRLGDRYVISSDGLTDYVARDTIDEVITTTADPGETADRLVALALRAGAPDNVTVVVGDLVSLDHRPAPPTQPQVVGAAAVRQSGTRPIPTTPAAKAAALTRQATAGTSDDDGPTLAEEGPRSRRSTVLRVAAALVVLAVVVAGGSYAVYAWSQQQYYLAVQDGVVTVFRGVDQTLGPVSLSSADYATTIPVQDLPTSYQDSLRSGIEVDDRAAAEARVAELRLQATACRWAQLNGEVCSTVPSTWTAPSPSPSPSPTATPTGSTSPSPSLSPSPGPSPTATPSPTSSPVTS
jgi:PPM family protein phosphatase